MLFRSPDWCASYGQLGLYRFVGASAAGKLHLRDFRPRDDAFAIRSAGPWIAAAVSDGVGSLKLSRYGSTYAVEALCEHMLREVSKFDSVMENEDIKREKQDVVKKLQTGLSFPDNKESNSIKEIFSFFPAFESASVTAPSNETNRGCGTMIWHRYLSETKTENVEKVVNKNISINLNECIRNSFYNTRQGIEQFAQMWKVSLRDFHCTLLGILINTKTGMVSAGQIGDGLIASFHPEKGASYLLNVPDPGEPGEVYVLTQKDWEKYFVVTHLSSEESEGIVTFYLMSDGVSEDCTHPPPSNIFHHWAEDINRELRKEEPLSQIASRLLQWLSTYEVSGSWDDRTLVVIMK